MQLSGRCVLVTGASSGIGAAAARAFSRRGAKVLLAARSADALEQLQEEITAGGGQAVALPADLTDPAQVKALAARVLLEHGAPDVLVNNAGAGRWLFADETSPDEAVAMMGAPYFAAFFLTAALLPAMRARGSGAILNMTSPVSFLAWPGATGYAAARWAMRGFNEALRADLRGSGITVTLVVPGEVSSSYFENNPGARQRIPKLARLFPVVTPEQVASAMVRGVEGGARTVVLPWLLWVTLLLARLFPGTVGALLAATGARYPEAPGP